MSEDALECIVYTTEPQLTRALAAEMRHNPAAARALIRSTLGEDPGQLL